MTTWTESTTKYRDVAEEVIEEAMRKQVEQHQEGAGSDGNITQLLEVAIITPEHRGKTEHKFGIGSTYYQSTSDRDSSGHRMLQIKIDMQSISQTPKL
jgi:hypothetical protein